MRRQRTQHGAEQRAVAVTGKDDLALLGELKEAVDRTLGLRQHGLVGRTAATAHGTAATVHEHQIDIVFLGPLGNALLRGVQREHGVVGPASLEESE